jgi:Uma2 family endonuclease
MGITGSSLQELSTRHSSDELPAYPTTAGNTRSGLVQRLSLQCGKAVGTPTTATLLTIEEFRKIPNPPDGHYELHHGELVRATYPKFEQKAVQNRLQELLLSILKPFGIVTLECRFGRLPSTIFGQQMSFSSDGIDGSKRRRMGLHWRARPGVEVVSPSNTSAELKDKHASHGREYKPAT